MVFRLPPMPRPGSIERHVVKKVKAHTREANARGLSMAAALPSNTGTSTSVQWPGHVVDPAWMKASNMVETREGTVAHKETAKPIPKWKDLILDGIEEQINERFNPDQTQAKTNKPVVLWEPLMCDFMKGLAYIIQRIHDEPAFLKKVQEIPAGLVEPRQEVSPTKLRDEMAPELNTLLKKIQESVTDGIGSYAALLDKELDTMVVRSVWAHDIKDASITSDITTDELIEAALGNLDDIAFEEEAARRGFRMTRL